MDLLDIFCNVSPSLSRSFDECNQAHNEAQLQYDNGDNGEGVSVEAPRFVASLESIFLQRDVFFGMM